MSTISNKEMDMLLDMFEFYSLNKLDQDVKNVSVFFNQMYETGDFGDVGDLYVKSKPLRELKQKAVNNINAKRLDMIALRNKLMDLK